jgi:hypothetical protein
VPEISYHHLKITPPYPTAMHELALGQLTPQSDAGVPDACKDHVLPPSFVIAIVPASPTATQAETVRQPMLQSELDVPGFRNVQLLPPLAVVTIVPPSPAA